MLHECYKMKNLLQRKKNYDIILNAGTQHPAFERIDFV